MKTSLVYSLTTIAALLMPSVLVRADNFQYPGLNDLNALFELPPVLEQAKSVRLVEVADAPYSNSRREFFASFLLLKPGSGNLEYGTLVYPLPVLTPHWENQAINPNYSPAFNIGAAYFISDTYNDLRTSWTHLDTTDSASFVGGNNNFAGPPYLIGPGANAYNFGSGSVNFRYDAVNFEAGHLFRAGRPFQVRVLGGVQYVSITQNMTGTFSSDSSINSQTYTTNSSFSGAGPRVGVNTQFSGRYFQFVGDMAAVALIGTQELNQTFNTVSPNFPGGNPQSFSSPNGTQVVPGLDSKLGGSYSFPFRRGIFKIEAGYQAAIYIGAVNSYSLGQVTTPLQMQDAGVFFATAQHEQSNFFAHGPYLSSTFSF